MDNRINNSTNQQNQQLSGTPATKQNKNFAEENAKKFSNQIAKKNNKKTTDNHEKPLSSQILKGHDKKSITEHEKLFSSQIVGKQGKKTKETVENQAKMLTNNLTKNKLQNKDTSKEKLLSKENLFGDLHNKASDHKNISQEKALNKNYDLATNKEQEVIEKFSEMHHNVSLNNANPLSLNNATAINNAQSDVNALLEKLADKIYTTAISSKSSFAGSEVKISLKNSILPNTEIHIQRTNAEITISFNTLAEQSKSLLVNNEASLQKILTEKFSGEKIQININLSQEQNQGQSRNEYISEEQLDDEDKG